MKRLEIMITKLLSTVCILLMGTMTVFVIVSVILRYVFSISFVWSEEFITFLFLATTYFGVPLGIHYNEHIQVEMVTDYLQEKGKALMGLLYGLIIATIQVVIFMTSLKWIQAVGNVLSPGTRIPIKFIYIFMPISCVLILFYTLIHMIGFVKTLVGKNEKREMEV